MAIKYAPRERLLLKMFISSRRRAVAAVFRPTSFIDTSNGKILFVFTGVHATYVRCCVVASLYVCVFTAYAILIP